MIKILNEGEELTLSDVVFETPKPDKQEEVPEGPEIGVDTTIADMLITAINDEWKTIQYYNTLISALDQASQADMIEVINDINNEEHKHVGQL